jgi:hypothetical protein
VLGQITFIFSKQQTLTLPAEGNWEGGSLIFVVSMPENPSFLISET